MEYLDFELEIGKGQGRKYPVAVIRSPAGEVRDTMLFPFDELVLENRLQALEIALLRSGGSKRRALSQEEQTVQDFGRDLFDALIGGEIRSRFDVSRGEAQRQGKGLRLKLRFQAPELAALPWEFLYDHRRGEYLCLSKKTPTIRYLELPDPIQRLTVTPPLRILGMIANPADLPELDVEREKQRLEKAVKNLRDKGSLDLIWLQGQTWRDLQDAMGGGPWHVFHFIGHGGFDRSKDEGLLALADDKGKKHLLSASQVANLLADHHPLRMVLLNACEGARGSGLDIFSSTAATLVRRGIAAVLAMQYAITDKAAIEFSRTFYRRVVDGRLPIEAAVVDARVAVNIAVNNSLEWGTPVLYMRSPDGILFELASLPAHRPDPIIVKAIVGTLPPEPPPPEIRKGRLWVDTDPDGSTVHFLNIRADFVQGQELEPGGYHVEVAAAGYTPKREWIKLEAGENKHHRIVLHKSKTPPTEPPKLPPPTEAKPEKEFTNRLGMAFVLLPAGTFPMGSPSDEEGRYDDERQHQVTLSRPFYLQTTPVTQEQWRQVLGNNPAYFKEGGQECPVEQVSWDDAQEFIKKLNRMEKTDTYRLPTEAEWEYACRAGSTTRYCFGDEAAQLQDYAWYEVNSERKTHPVGRLKPNAWGLYDMHGNVWEWCRDWYGDYAVGPLVDPPVPDAGASRVLRGGSWGNNSWLLRSAVRSYYNPVFRINNLGFRVARTF
jgi:formylglycine-generating enzyme required for sulfatase activity